MVSVRLSSLGKGNSGGVQYLTSVFILRNISNRDFKFGCSHHDPVGVCGPLDNKTVMEGEEGLKGWMKKKLSDSGELTGEPTYSHFVFFGHTNALAKVSRKSDLLQKKLGEPALPMGGPGFDGMGSPVQVPQ